MMSYVYDESRAAEAAAWLLCRRGAPMTFLKLLKLLYMADRESLRLRGVPLTGDAMVSMDKGPVLSRTYDLIRGSGTDPAAQARWNAYVCRPDPNGWIVKSRVEPAATGGDTDWFPSLSESDRDILNSTDAAYGAMTESELIEVGHQLPEWEDPKGSSIRIDPVRILEDVGMSPEQIRALSVAAQERHALRRALGLR